MESYNLYKCGQWASGSPLYDARTEGQLHADQVRKWEDRAERECKVLHRADLTDDGFDKLHFYPVEGAPQTYP